MSEHTKDPTPAGSQQQLVRLSETSVACVMPSGTACDMRCCFCGRPIIGNAIWGASGPYHLECTIGGPGAYPQTYTLNPWVDPLSQLEDLRRRVEELERRIMKSPNAQSSATAGAAGIQPEEKR